MAARTPPTGRIPAAGPNTQGTKPAALKGRTPSTPSAAKSGPAPKPTKEQQPMAKEIAVSKVVEDKALPAILDEKPSYLKVMEAQNKPVASQDNFDNTDVVVPRIKLLQGTSKECEQFDTAKPGIFWHSGFDLALGPEITFVVCSRRKRYLLIAPMDDGQGVLARADDSYTWDKKGEWQIKLKDRKEKVTWAINDLDVEKSGLSAWGTSCPDDKDSPPAATLFYDYLVYLPDHMELGPAVISLARTAIRSAKKGLNDKIQLHAQTGRPMQSIAFAAKSVVQKNDSNQESKNWHFTGAGFASEELYLKAVELKSALASYVVQDEAGAAAEGDPDASAATKPKGEAGKNEEY